MDDEDAVLLTDALPTGYFGAQLGDIVEGDVVVVFGAGPVGLFAAKSAWLMGAGRVIVDRPPGLPAGEGARASPTPRRSTSPSTATSCVEMKKPTDFLGADVAIDAVGAEADGNFFQHVTASKLKLQGGSPVALNWAIDSVRKGGDDLGGRRATGPLFSAVKIGDRDEQGPYPAHRTRRR